MTDADIQAIARLVHQHKDHCDAEHDRANDDDEDAARAILALLGDRLLPEGFEAGQHHPVFGVEGGVLVRRQVREYVGPAEPWGGSIRPGAKR